MPVPARRSLAALTAAGLLSFGLVACGSGEDDAGDPGKPGDKTITVYSGRNENLVKPLLDKFSQQSGITVKTRYATTAQLAAQLVEEGDKSPADAFFAQDAGALGAVAKRDMFAPLPAAALEKVPQTYRARNGQWVGVSARSRVLAYNADMVPAAELPKSVFELTDPKWKGKIGVAPTNGSFQAFVTAIRVQHGDQKAKDFLAGLKANEPQIRDNNVKIVEDVEKGTIPVGLVNHYYIGEVAKEKGTTPDGLKVKLHFFPGGDTGALVNVAGVGVLKRSAEDPDTRAFVDFLLSTESQKYFAEQTFEYPVVTGVAAPAGVPPLADLDSPDIDLNDLDTLDATITMIKDSGLVP
ncbi:iron ABC transporter substrate-binding protein [Micromonospora coxensis]|uniref:iron ABC transporter substrate-binding protein n=1 Tax=Micromonospora coxensis TaxID=356852 RepID=UPI003427B80C